jgi:hypothetical protein
MTREAAILPRTTAPNPLAIAGAATRSDGTFLGSAGSSLEKIRRKVLPARSSVVRDPAKRTHRSLLV